MPESILNEPLDFIPQQDAFQKLVQDLRDVLGPSSGIDSDDVDPSELQSLMANYKSNPMEWQKYALGDSNRAYTRNLVDRGNGKSNLMVLVWTPGKASPIHDHANAHCVMKVLSGSLRETLYQWPDEKDSSPLAVKKETLYEEGQVTYMSDKLGLHKISNLNPNEYAISLHLYTPPHAATFGCHIFDERTGKSSHVKQCVFFSEKGHKL